ncbi:hypothetical protein M9Y10_022859 [Tritrichomonas musculus]|uniref:Uncharacterized protein n=1 Tax=Tritrichomonas musculus TaxID=1915356 RepID=A0ABR2KWT6_9EUKA
MSNAALNLKNLLSQDTFINEDIFPSSFISLLSSLCDMINDQDQVINALSEKSNEFATKSDINDNINLFKSIRNEIEDNISAVKNNLQNDIDTSRAFQATRINEIEKKFKSVDDTVHEAVNLNLESFKQSLEQVDFSSKEMKNEIASLQSSSRATSSLVTQLRSLIPQNPESRLNHFSKKIDQVENSQRNMLKELKANNEDLKDEIKELRRDNEDMKMELHNTILELEAKAKRMPSTYEGEDNQPKIVNGEVDISPLIRGIYRDSKRLDGFNEVISMTRMEVEDVVNSLIELQEKIQQFNTVTHDLSLENGHLQGIMNDKTNFLHSSIASLERQIGELWTITLQISDSSNHFASNVSNTTQQVQSILSTLSNRPIPILNDLTDVMLEVHGLHDSIFEKRTQFEGEREQFRKLPGGGETLKTVPDIKVRPMLRRMKPLQETLDSSYEETNQKAEKSMTTAGKQMNEALFQKSIEELKDTINEIISDNDYMAQQIEKLMKTTKENLELKVDNQTLERMLNKIHMIIGHITKRIDTVEDKENTMIEAMKLKRKVQDPNAPSAKFKKKISSTTVMDRTFPSMTVPSEVPPLKIGNAKPISSLAARIQGDHINKTPSRPKSSQKLASDFIINQSVK